MVIEQNEAMESIPVDWLTGLAVDWVAGNMYWSDPKRGVIEVSRLNGSARYVVLSDEIGKPSSLVVDPAVGLLVWAGTSRVESSGLDGSDRKLLSNHSFAISDVTLDMARRHVYWCDSSSNTIERMHYNGSGHEVLLNHSLENPVALTVLDDVIYWMDTYVQCQNKVLF